MFKKRKGLLLSVALLSSLVAAVIAIANAGPARTAASDNGFKQQVRNAIVELALPSGGNQQQLAVGAENLAGFISYRSGVLISDWNLEQLSEAEGFAHGTGKSVSKDKLAELMTAIAVDKLRNLTDEQKQSAVAAMGGFNHPDLPESFRRGRESVSLRASGKGRMTRDGLSSQIEILRGENAENKIVRSMIRNAIALEIESVCAVLIDADPEFFGGTKCEMTPMQALLVAYAVATDDMLAGNRADIQAKMSAIQAAASEAAASPYPTHVGQKPYGVNGYVFSTPADLLLDNAAVQELVTKLSQTVR
ncbi:MAG: hypothetical protein IPM63_17925 [Acidobacteriota bacterium]|nr:MAG: hypothetical protein IPM63_17925 [Acidobacteriota bacterium]